MFTQLNASVSKSIKLTGFLFLLFSCGSYGEFENTATKNYSTADQQKFAKYMIQGKILYTTHCSNCHQADGSGLGKLIPPLAGADYLLADANRAACIIKNGMSGEIEVNGTTYNQAMPALTELTNLEIGMLSTYVYNSWGHEKGLVTADSVAKALQTCNQ
jgi:cytochrome c551